MGIAITRSDRDNGHLGCGHFWKKSHLPWTPFLKKPLEELWPPAVLTVRPVINSVMWMRIHKEQLAPHTTLGSHPVLSLPETPESA